MKILSDVRIEIESIEIDFYRMTWADRIIAPIVKRFVNLSLGTQDFYERRMALCMPRD